jgi:hypothetical protein
MEQTEIMTMKEICGYLRANRNLVLGLIDDGLPYFLLDGHNKNSHKRFKKSEVDDWLSRKSRREKT